MPVGGRNDVLMDGSTGWLSLGPFLAPETELGREREGLKFIYWKQKMNEWCLCLIQQWQRQHKLKCCNGNSEILISFVLNSITSQNTSILPKRDHIHETNLLTGHTTWKRVKPETCHSTTQPLNEQRPFHQWLSPFQRQRFFPQIGVSKIWIAYMAATSHTQSTMSGFILKLLVNFHPQ